MLAHHGRLASYAVVLITCVGVTGCRSQPPESGASAALPVDPLVASMKDAEPEEQPYFEPARPFLDALVRRDYAALYRQLSPYAIATIDPQQFYPSGSEEEPLSTQSLSAQPLVNVSLEQFQQWMQKVEANLGVPRSLDFVYVQSVNPAELTTAGRGTLEHMMAVGGIPDEVPDQIRKASLRADPLRAASRASHPTGPGTEHLRG